LAAGRILGRRCLERRQIDHLCGHLTLWELCVPAKRARSQPANVRPASIRHEVVIVLNWPVTLSSLASATSTASVADL
jgi:hypothetical protein